MFWILTLLLFNYFTQVNCRQVEPHWSVLISDISRFYRTEFVEPVASTVQDLVKPRPALLYIYQR